MNNDKRIELLIINVIIMLIIWIYPTSFTGQEKLPVKLLEPTYISKGIKITSKYVASETQQVVVDKVIKTELADKVKYQELVGNKLVATDKYKRIKYLGRYVFINPNESSDKVEYVYVTKYTTNNIDYYAYDLYQIEKIIISEPIYETRYKNIYSEVEYLVYETKTRDIYHNVIEEVKNIELLSNYNYLIDNEIENNSYKPIIFLEPYKRYKIIFV